MRDTGKRKETVLVTILFAGYLLFNGVLLLGHELWRDEANVWLIARELSPIELLREIKYQGHPCLWYFLVMPFAKLGLPFKTISVLSCLVMAAAAGLFAYRGPVCLPVRALCLFSPIFSYYYSVVARNYCLIALLLLLLAWVYPGRGRRPALYGLLLGLLVQADSVAIAPAGLICAMWLWESAGRSIREKKLSPLFTAAKGLWIPLASLFLWIAQFYQVSDSPEFHFHTFSASGLIAEIRNYSYVILTRLTGGGRRVDQLLILLFLAAAVSAGIRLRNAWPGIVAAGAFLFEALFSIMVYQLHIWHYIALCFVLVWFVWICFGEDGIRRREGKDGLFLVSRIASEALLGLLAVLMFVNWNGKEESSSLSNALFGVYSDGKNAASYIRENVPEDELVFSTNVSEASTVLAYLGPDYTFYFVGSLQPECYADYREGQSRRISYEELTGWIRERFPHRESFYLVECPTSCLVDVPDKDAWELCYQTAADTARGEDYRIWRVPL